MVGSLVGASAPAAAAHANANAAVRVHQTAHHKPITALYHGHKVG